MFAKCSRDIGIAHRVPASTLTAIYLRLSAMIGRQFGHDEAVQLARQAGGDIENHQGPAIWTLGGIDTVAAVPRMIVTG